MSKKNKGTECSETPSVRKVNGMTAFERYVVDCKCGYSLMGNTEEEALALWRKHREGGI